MTTAGGRRAMREPVTQRGRSDQRTDTRTMLLGVAERRTARADGCAQIILIWALYSGGVRGKAGPCTSHPRGRSHSARSLLEDGLDIEADRGPG
jgi:hypothetical protein